jgi:hypothetical protein
MKLHKIPVVAPLLTPALAAGIGGGGASRPRCRPGGAKIR